jgi:DNA repair protein RadC
MSNFNSRSLAKNRTIIKTISWKFKDSSKEYPMLKGQKPITSSKLLFEQFNGLFKDEVQEKFVVFWLSTVSKVIGFEVIAIGTLNSTVVHPREVFRGAIVASCNSIMIAHNHPSGNPEPSKEDIEISRRIELAGRIINIEVLDSIIFTNNEYFSMRDNKLL